MNRLIEFLSLQDPNVRWVVLGVMMMCASSALTGVFAFLRKRALVGDAISHSILPGICLAFMLTGLKSPWILLPGAVLTGWLSLWLIDVITSHSKIKSDSAIALVLSVFYGIGILLLTSIQNSGNANQSGLDKFLLGKAAAMVFEDVITFGIFSVGLVLVIFLFYKSFKLVCFDRDFALALGIKVKRIEMLLSVITVMAVAIGIQAVGVVLMAALLITPAASARYWTNNLKVMLVLSAVLGAFSGVAGAFVSYTMPKMPTGPWIVMCLSLLAVISVFLGTQQGVLSRQRQQHKNQRKILEENILKCLYHLSEKEKDVDAFRSLDEILAKRLFYASKLKAGLKRLINKGLISKKEEEKVSKYQLTSKGITEGKRITRIHRLWELYLSKQLNLPDDHVHEDAEAIEHIITPELEKELEKQLNYPTEDPHQSPIPT
jgi:manganese/zinc/iron transport system permease protein